MHPHIQYLLTFLLLFFSCSLQAQQDTLLDFDKRMKHLKTAHGKVLASWAGLNVVGGGILTFTTDEPSSYFHAMNASWGIVNTGIAAFVYYHHNHIFNQPQTLLQQMDHQRHVEKVMLFNIGLDIAYIAGGIGMYQYGNGTNINYPELWKGFGSSIILQGAFLLVQDFIFYRLHAKNRKKVYPVWRRMMEKL